MIYLIIIVFLNVVLGNKVYYHEDDLPGIVLVPGDGGNKLETKLVNKKSYIKGCHTDIDWHLAWVNITELSYAECWSEDMKLHYNFSTHKSHNTEGVSVRVPSFGTVEPMMVLDNFAYVGYFSSIVYMLEYMGYKRNVNIKGAAFDFRYAPNEMEEYFSSLKSLIEQTADETGGPIILMVHSMGAPLTNYFLNMQSQSWKEMFVSSIISLAGAWGGSTKTIKVYAAGDDMDSPFDQYKLRNQQRSDPSLAFLLPDPDLWGDEVLVSIMGANYTINDVEAFLGALDLVEAIEIYHDVKPMIYKSHRPPHVPIHCLYGSDVSTDERIEYVSPRFFPDTPIIHKGPGDGTVNHRSLDLCRQYGEQQREPVYIKSYKNVDHMKILHNSDAMKYISNVVTDEALVRATLSSKRSNIPGLQMQSNSTEDQTLIEEDEGHYHKKVNSTLVPFEQLYSLESSRPKSGYRQAGNVDFYKILKGNKDYLDKLFAEQNIIDHETYKIMKTRHKINKLMKKKLEDEHMYISVIKKLLDKQKHPLENNHLR